MAARSKLNHRGMQELLTSSGVRADLTGRMERALAEAQRIAPVGSGDYRDSLHLEQTTTDRAVVRLVADVDYVWFVEAQHGTLARALDVAK